MALPRLTASPADDRLSNKSNSPVEFETRQCRVSTVGLFQKAIVLLTLAFAILFANLGCKQSPSARKSATDSQDQAVAIDPTTTGSIQGTITFEGPPPRLPMLDMSADPGCPAQPQASDVVVLRDGKLANVFVYVKEGLPAGRFPVPSQPAVLDQKGCRYVPHVMGVMAGQQLKILNSDPAEHNVHPMSNNNLQWNESQPPGGAPIVKTFTTPEIMMAVHCNQHPWMWAYISVMTHPYYAVSGQDGKFDIRNLPPGEYTIAAVHEKYGEQTIKIKVTTGGSAAANFAFHPPE